MPPLLRVALLPAIGLAATLLIGACSSEDDEPPQCSFEPTNEELVLTGLRSRVAVHEDNLYWTLPEGVFRADLDGQSIEQLADIDSMPGDLIPRSPVVDEQMVFWMEPSRAELRRLELATGIVSTLADDLPSFRGGFTLVADESALYWNEGSAGTAASVPKLGGVLRRWTVESFPGPFDPRSVVVRDGALYVNAGARLHRLELSTDELEIVAEPASGYISTGFEVDDAHVYYTNQVIPSDGPGSSELLRVPRTGGTPETLFVQDGDLLHVLTDDGANVYVGDGERLALLSKDTGEATTVFDCRGAPAFARVVGDWLYWTPGIDDETGTTNLWRIPR